MPEKAEAKTASRTNVVACSLPLSPASPLIKPLRLRYNIGWSAIGNAAYYGFQYIFLILLAKLTTQFQVGQYSLALSIAAPIYALTGMHLRAFIATECDSKYKFSDYLSARMFMSGSGIIIVFMISFFWIDNHTTKIVAIIIGISKAIESLSDIYYGLFQKNQRMNNVAISMILRGAFSCFFSILILYLTNNLILACLCLILVWGGVLFFYDMRKSHEMNNKVVLTNKKIIQLITRAYPMAIAMLLGSLFLLVPRYLLQHYFGESKVGLFSALFNLAFLISLIGGVIAQAISPRLRISFKDKRPILQPILALPAGAIILCGTIAFIIIKFYGNQVISLLYTPEYAKQNESMLLLIIVGVVLGVNAIFDYALIAQGEFKKRVIINLISLLIVASLGVILIPQNGLYGAAIALLISSLSVFFLLTITLSRKTTHVAK